MRFEDFRAVRDSDLRGSNLRLVLLVLMTYTDKLGSAYPSVPTLVRGTRLAPSTVRECLSELVVLGIVECPQGRKGGRRSTLYIVRTDRLRPTDTPPPPGGAPPLDVGVQTTETPSPPHRHPARTPPGGGAEPSIHRPREQISEPSSVGAKTQAASALWMDGPERSSTSRVRGEMEQAGIRGPLLDRLAASPKLTPDLVRRESDSVKSDPNVRNQAAVLVKRLAGVADVRLSNRQPLRDSDRAAIVEIERRRRQGARRVGATPVGDELGGRET